MIDNDGEQKIEFSLDSSNKKFDLSNVNRYKSLKDELNKNILVGFSGKSGSFTEEALNKFFNKNIKNNLKNLKMFS